jgi:hypothetical protein
LGNGSYIETVGVGATPYLFGKYVQNQENYE